MQQLTILRCLLLCLGMTTTPAALLHAQCGCAYQFETTFPATVRAAPVVIEGKITDGSIDFGGENNQDWRSSTITVYKVLKGDFEATEETRYKP